MSYELKNSKRMLVADSPLLPRRGAVGGRGAKDRKISAANLVQAAQAMGFCRALLPRVDSELREILAAARPDDRWAERQTIYSFVV